MKPFRTFALLALSLALAGLLTSVHAEGGTLRVKVTGLRNGEGNIACALFSREQDFLISSAAVAATMLPAVAPMTECIFSNVKVGRYAISVLHDENKNGVIDKNFLGIPTEGYGVSNNKTHATHAPVFEESAFTYDRQAELVLTITLRY